ncbi:hypothetical protein TNCV_2126301 [Trichonephila clavipes]|nr:hypothetical protein TNCV_2126301 [Trichonephila clavipes]
MPKKKKIGVQEITNIVPVESQSASTDPHANARPEYKSAYHHPCSARPAECLPGSTDSDSGECREPLEWGQFK